MTIATDALAIAAVNATILAIALATLSGLSYVFFQEVDRRRNALLESANRINRLGFGRTVLVPAFPVEEIDPDRLRVILRTLSLGMTTIVTRDGLPVRADALARSQAFVVAANAVANRFPFFKLGGLNRIVDGKVVEARNESVDLRTTQQVGAWVDEAMLVLEELRGSVSEITRANAEAADAQSGMPAFYAGAVAEFDDFRQQAEAVAWDTWRLQEEFDRYHARLPIGRCLAAVLAIAIVGICGVCVPLMDSDASHWLIATVPAVSYALALLCAVVFTVPLWGDVLASRRRRS